MGLPHITSFCWCMGLESGARVVGVMHLIASGCLLIVTSLMAHDAGSYVGTIEDEGDHIYSIWYRIAIGAAVLTTVHVLLALALLYAVYKRHMTVLRAYVYIMCILYVCALLYIIITAAMRGLSGSGSDVFLAFLEAVLVFGFLAYCILCVHSYYLMLRSAEDMEGPNKVY
ncbi:uncharacterized protein LOC134671194 [Cydia fagiglandana]|uniref:uncharacterized protein LOC134671194 n=1 Tax=Cydia fagiglandana TaxID=1458189 RepID=UPI002FEDFC89